MRLALYSLILLGTVLLVLDLSKLIKGITPPEKPIPVKATPAKQPEPNPGSTDGRPDGHPDVAQALALYTQAIENSPDEAKPYVDRANAYIANNDYAKAIADYDQAIKLDPLSTDHLIQRGTLYLSTNDPDQAIANFTKALELNPELIKALAYRAITNFRHQKHQAALDDCLLMLKKDPAFTDLHTTIAQCYQALGQSDKAISHLKIYLQSTKDPQAKQDAETLLKKWTNQPAQP
jgi:tetratricopeptide (TPR) repeat protein